MFYIGGWNPGYIPVKYLTSVYLIFTLKTDLMNVSIFLPWSVVPPCCNHLRGSCISLRLQSWSKNTSHRTCQKHKGVWNRLLFWQAEQTVTDAVKNTLRFAVSRSYFQLLMILSNCTTFFHPRIFLCLVDFYWKLPAKTWCSKRGKGAALPSHTKMFHVAALAVSCAAAYPWCLERWLPCAVTKTNSHSWWSQWPLKNTTHSGRIEQLKSPELQICCNYKLCCQSRTSGHPSTQHRPVCHGSTQKQGMKHSLSTTAGVQLGHPAPHTGVLV